MTPLRWSLLALSLVACKDPVPSADRERVASRTQPTATATAASTSTAAAQATAKADTHKPGKNKAAPIEWDGTIAWKSWEEGSKLARASNKPIFLLVYADWCPHCKSLKTVFADDEIKKLAETMVMVRQDADDDDASWLQAKVGQFGGYVPRIFFLGPDGTVKPEITSNNTRFPYFYTPEGIASLKASMKRAAGG